MLNTFEMSEEKGLGASLVDISVLVPTLNESENVASLTNQLNVAMADLGRTWELLFLDDSDDITPEAIDELRETNPHVFLLHRERGQRSGGLGGAVVAGIGAACGEVVVIMDGDLQHPPQMVRELSTAVLSGKYDIAVASRYVTGASNSGLDNSIRRFISRCSVSFAHLLLPTTRGVKDPMSGFFAVSREKLARVQLRPHGFKILMEVLARDGDLRVAEIPFQMNSRVDGVSKASSREGIRFIRHAMRLLRGRWSTSKLRESVLVRVPLGVILSVQAALSYKLIYRNTAFIDEATYLSAGHYELHALFHGGPNLAFPTYFSGAPTIYPVLGALVDDVGGLRAVRFMSMGFMLLATMLCYATANRLWGRLAGFLAAGLFVTTQGTQFLGALATFDAMSLMLMALAGWIVVRSAASVRTSSLIYVAVPVMVVANATKYASALFDPIVILLAFFVVLSYHNLRSAFRTGAMLLASLALLLTALVAIVPTTYWAGISETTVNRLGSNSTPRLVLLQSWNWVGGVAVVAILATVVVAALAWRRKSSWAEAGIIGVLALAVLLAPLNQARIHTITSLSKHVTFGAWFGAVAAGWLVHSISGVRGKRIWKYVAVTMTTVVCLVVMAPLLVVGTRQADHLDDEWPNSTAFISALRPLVTNLNRPILVDDSTIGAYYLQRELPLPFWYNTFYFSYVLPRTKVRVDGAAAYRAAIRDDWFSVVALNWSTQQKTDDVVAAAMRHNKNYVWVGDFAQNDIYGHGAYVVWRLKDSRQ